MKTNLSSKFTSIALLSAAMIFFPTNSIFAAGTLKKPHTRTRTGTYQTSKGNSGTYSRTTTREKGQTERNTSVTNQDGKTATHDSTRTWDKTSGTGTISSSSTSFEGKTTSREGTITKTDDGTFESQGTLTGPKGKTSTYDITTTKTDDGRSSTGTITGPNGKQSTVTSTTIHPNVGETERTMTVNTASGKSLERVIDTKLNGDGTGTRTIELTKPDGSTETRTVTFTVDPKPTAAP